MRILISNDDGYLSKGIQTLRQYLQKKHQVVTVAPDRDVSGCSSSLTLRKPLAVQQVEQGLYKVDGSAADCVHLALNGLFDQAFDVVVSGINAGANMSDDLWYSGTIGAAREGRFLPSPPIAVSLISPTGQFTHYETAALVVEKILESRFYQSVRQKDILININVPDVPWSNIGQFCMTQLASRFSTQPIIHSKTPKGQTIYWIGPAGDIDATNSAENSDVCVLNKPGFVSVTPITLNLANMVDKSIEGGFFDHEGF